MRLSSSRHRLVPLHVALFGTAPSCMDHPHHDSHRKGAHALVSQTMEVPQTGLNRPNQPAPLIRHRPPLPSCGDIGTVLRLQSVKQSVPSRFFRKLIEAASAPPCSSPPPSCSARPSPPASTCPGTSSCPIRAPRCTSASPSPASGPSCRPGRSLRLSSSA